MAVLVKITNPGVDAALYEQIKSAVEPGLKASAGFQMHIGRPAGTGWEVLELWDSAEQHDEWFKNNVEPNLPPGTSTEVFEVHAVVTP